jgi:hypothetical protein
MPSDRGPQNLSKEIELCDAAGTNAHRFSLAEDEYGRLLWDQGSVPAEGSEPGEELIKTWDYFGGGMGETYDFEERFGYKSGGYYFSNNWQVSNPYRLRPRQELSTLTLTSNPSPVTQFFEAASASGIKYLYSATQGSIFKVQISGTPALKNTKSLASGVGAQFATGSYTCASQSLTFTVPFTVKAVIIKAIDGAYAAGFKTDDMTDGKYKEATGTFYETGTIGTGVSFSSGHVIVWVGAATSVFHTGTTYCWMAFGGDNVRAGVFSGDGTDSKDITVETSWGQPDALFLMSTTDTDPVYFRNKTCTADLTMNLGGAVKPIADVIQATAGWPTDGFEVGTLGNLSGTNNVFYIALKTDTDVLEVGTYTGTGADLAVTTPNFSTTYALIYADEQNLPAVHRSNYNTGDSSMYFTATVNAANLVQTLTSTGFTVGDSTPPTVNINTKVFYYLVARTDPGGDTVCGQPAYWNEIWELPLGALVDRIALTTIVDGTGDDTWTTRATGSPKASHLCVVENELVRASANRMVDKCSASDTDVDGNWTGDYYVGPPGTVITKLVNIGGECGVAATDGFYLWDTVSISRQQLPFLGAVRDDENGKGTIVISNMVLVPTVDGYWRLVSGSAAQVGPDAQRDYVPVAGPSSIPIRLKHYGTDFLGTYIYHACYDGTNYHIIYTQLDPNRPTLVGAKWDFLLTTTTEIKEIKITSERQLVFSYGNDLGYFQLSRGGAPEGGNWGQASTTGYFYLPITKMRTEALKRLRLVELQVDDIAANFTFGCAVYRDGATVETVGSALSADGVGECFWTAGTTDTAREIQLRAYWTGAAGYTPGTTAPSIRRVTLHAEALDEDADLIVCSIKLTGNAKEQTAIIDGHLNAGPMKLKNPFTGTKETVVLYRRRLYSLQQQGNSPPIAACELRFRRSDVA